MVAELGLRGEVLDPRPVLTVIERHVIDVEADQEKYRCRRETENAVPGLEHRIAVSDVARDERAIEPLQRGGRQQLVRKVQPRIARVAVVDGARQGQDGELPSLGCDHASFAVHVRIAACAPPDRGRQQELLRRASPVERRLEGRKRDRFGELIGPAVDGGLACR